MPRSIIQRLLARPTMNTETLAVFASLFFAALCNGAFWRSVMAGRSAGEAHTWLFAGAMLLGLVALHVLILSLVLHRRIAKPLLAILFVCTAFATYYMQAYGIYLDPSMLRNVLRTDPAEARELFGWGLVPHLLLYAVLPTVIVWRVNLRARPLARALLVRAGVGLLAAALVFVALISVFADISALIRNQKELRYLITPANYLYSVVRATGADVKVAQRPRTPVGTDARLGPSWQQRSKPVMFVLVVGETARASNWGLDGYTRQTTPELAALPGLLNFPDAHSCGTNTETSLPCMFSQIGRRDYDESRIRGSENLLDVLARSGFEVLWRDNQSGCKGVCRGVKDVELAAAKVPGLCADGRCFDEILLDGLDTVARDAKGNLFVVLHMLGNHGPAYFRRYPPEFRRFTPACKTDELRNCSREQIVNAYDNALLYTDHVLARTIGFLKGQTAYDSALYFVSDHGESLGEDGLYLHGVPYPIAPSEQTHVPMVWWLSPGYAQSFGIDMACLAGRTKAPASHDHLFHSILGLLDVNTSAYDKAWDISAPCRTPESVARIGSAEASTPPPR